MAQEKLTLVKFVEELADGHVVALFGQTRHGKTTFCRTLTYEAITRYDDEYYVIYIDTECSCCLI